MLENHHLYCTRRVGEVKTCSHLTPQILSLALPNAVRFARLRQHLRSKDTIRSGCDGCGSVHVSRPHICLSCVFVACMGNGAGKPSSSCIAEHCRSQNHHLAFDLERMTVFCFGCGDVVYDQRISRTIEQTLMQAKEDHMNRKNQSALNTGDLSIVPPTKRKKGEEFMRAFAEPWIPTNEEITCIAANSISYPQQGVFGLRGFNNMGNTCFINCILQMFLHSTAMRSFYLADGHDRKRCRIKEEKGEKVCIGCELDLLFSTVFAPAAAAPLLPPSAAHQAPPPLANGNGNNNGSNGGPNGASPLPSTSSSSDAAGAVAGESNGIDGSNNNNNSSINNGDNPNANHTTAETNGSSTDAINTNNANTTTAPPAAAAAAAAAPLPPSVPPAALPPASLAAVSPHSFLFALWQFSDHLAGYEQQDAHEFLIATLNGIHHSSQVTEDGSSECECLVHSLFNGKMRSDCKCSSCSAVSTVVDPFFDISLDIRGLESTLSIKDCLQRFTSVESLGETSWTCDKCHDRNGTKQLSLHSPPNLLVLHLKRFDHSSRVASKLSSFVSFPLQFDASPFHENSFKSQSVAEQEGGGAAGGDAIWYELFGVVSHQGSIEVGHYSSYLREGGSWFKCDDASVTQVDPEVVLQTEAYLLFYSRRYE